MTVAELIKQLQTVDPTLPVWVSDGGQAEGSTPFKGFDSVLAYGNGLDGDHIEKEYLYEDNVVKPATQMIEEGYTLIAKDEVWSKKVLIIKSWLDKD